jgi:hypothetical protein
LIGGFLEVSGSIAVGLPKIPMDRLTKRIADRIGAAEAAFVRRVEGMVRVLSEVAGDVDTLSEAEPRCVVSPKAIMLSSKAMMPEQQTSICGYPVALEKQAEYNGDIFETIRYLFCHALIRMFPRHCGVLRGLAGLCNIPRFCI